MGKTSTTTEALQLCIPCSLERAPPARHYFINIKDFGLYKYHTCGTAVPRGTIQRASKYDPTDIKSFPFPSAPFSGRSLPSPRVAGRGLGNLSLFVLSRPFWATFYVFIQAICLPGKGKRPPPSPWPLLAVSCLATLPFQPRAARAGWRWLGGFLFPLKYSWRGVGLWRRPPPAPPEWYDRLVPDRSLSKDLLKPH